MGLLKPVDIVNDSNVSGFDASVLAIDSVGTTNGGVLEAAGALFGGKEFDVIAQRGVQPNIGTESSTRFSLRS